MKVRAIPRLATLAMLAACASTSSPSAAPATSAAPTASSSSPPAPPPPLDHGAPSTTYPAFTPEMPAVVDQGGSVLTAPVIVTVTAPGEPNADAFEALGDALGPSAYWKTVTSEYDVGAATSGAAGHLRLDKPFTTSGAITDAEIDAFVSSSITAPSSAWPAPTSQTIYVLYLPPATKLLLNAADACDQGVGGYHDSTKTTVNGISVVYAVVPQCSGLDAATLAASHELAEAADDPHPSGAPAFLGFDTSHVAWELLQAFHDETGDACEFYADARLAASAADVGFVTQRQWSNASAAKGHDPCVPLLASEVYFNTTPLDLENVEVDLGSVGRGRETTKGYVVAVGQTRQVPIGFYSDGAKDAWTIAATSGGAFTGASSLLALSLDTKTGQNGQKAYLSITVKAAGTSGAELVTIASTDGASTHYMPILVGTPAK